MESATTIIPCLPCAVCLPACLLAATLTTTLTHVQPNHARSHNTHHHHHQHALPRVVPPRCPTSPALCLRAPRAQPRHVHCSVASPKPTSILPHKAHSWSQSPATPDTPTVALEGSSKLRGVSVSGGSFPDPGRSHYGCDTPSPFLLQQRDGYFARAVRAA